MEFTISFYYNKREPLYENFSLPVPDTGITVLCGHNGVGKTTLLKCICGILPGIIEKPAGWFVSATGGLMRYFTLKDHLQIMGVEKTKADKINELLDLFQFKELYEKKISRLSTGQTMIAALIAAFVSNESLLLFDEPFAGLDPVNADKLSGVLKKESCKRAIIITSHDLYRTAEIADTIHIIKNGVISWTASRPTDGKIDVSEVKAEYAQNA